MFRCGKYTSLALTLPAPIEVEAIEEDSTEQPPLPPDRSSSDRKATTARKAGLAHKVFLKAAKIVPLPAQRMLRTGPVGKIMRFVLDLAAPAGRYEVLPVSSGILKGAMLEVDVRKQREMVAGTYESKVQNVLAEHLADGDVAFDVGAHLGFFTLLLARLVREEGTVVSVEPDPFMGPKLEANLENNSASNVRVVRAAAGTVASERRFSPGAGGGIGHLADDGEIEVPGTTLDQLAEHFGAPKLIKIDVEGGELEVLEGASVLLSAHRPVLVVEVHDGQIQSDAENLLNGLDYDISFIEDDPSQRRHLVAVPRYRSPAP